MNDRPTALELICIANETLTRSVLPDASPEQQFALRMIASALGIAGRELETHAKNDGDEMQRFNTLYAAIGGPAIGGHDLQSRNRKLALDIRHGLFENNPEQQAQLRQHLLVTARAKLAVSYPKGLEIPVASGK